MDYPQKVPTNYYLKQSGIDYPNDGLRFYDVRNAPFTVYGLMGYENGEPFRRMPWEIAHAAMAMLMVYLPFEAHKLL